MRIGMLRVASLILVAMTLCSCASEERKPFMIIGERNLNNGKGIGIGVGAKLGGAKFKKTPDFELNYDSYDVTGVRYGVGGGFNMNRFAFGVGWFETYSYYQKTREQDSKRLERFWSREQQGTIWGKYFHEILADWSNQSFQLSYSFYNRLKFNSLPSGKEPTFSSNNLSFNYSVNLRRLGFNAAIKVGGLQNGELSGIGYCLGMSYVLTRSFSLGAELYRVNYDNRLVFEEMIIHIDYRINIF